MGISAKPFARGVRPISVRHKLFCCCHLCFPLPNFSCDNRIESRVDFQYPGTRPLCPLRLLNLRLTLSAKIQAAAVVRPFIVGPQVAEAATKIGDETSLAEVRGIF